MRERTVVQSDVFDALPELPDGFGSAALVDFPWEFDAENNTGRMAEGTEVKSLDYEVTDHERLATVLDELSRVIEDGGWVFVFADDEVYPEFRRIVEDSKLTYRRTLAWDQERMGMGYYHRVQHYPILSATNGDTDRYVQGRGTVFRAETVSRSTDYPTAKPPALARQLLKPPVLEEGERLLEPFCGTAPGGAAWDGAYWGADIRPRAVNMAQENVAQRTLHADGGTPREET